MPDTIGRYRLTAKLGEGGMGVVYAARDERLDRPVAIKMIRGAAADGRARERLWREARAAASISHPNVCQLYEIAEDGGQLFLAMELLEGEALAARIARGPLAVREAVPLALALLGALGELHRRDLVHRDLKPSNIFLTPHGAKLLDFGLARSVAGDLDRTGSILTLEGTIIGTPAYMAPEQLRGEVVDARADLFATGVILYEMLTGRPPFAADSAVDSLHAVLHEQPPALGGSPAIAAVDRVIHRALAKRAADRYGSAGEMADDLRQALTFADSGEALQARPMTRLIVLPFRMLRPDPETDFLSFSLSDAVASTLSGVESLVVRSSLVASRFGVEAPDLRTIAAEADVDVVLTGTLLRGGEQLRVTTQLLEAPGGTILWSQTSQVALGDIFQLQDDLASRIVESLALPLTARDRRLLTQDVPASAKAYELYLRANQMAAQSATWPVARELYEACVQEDPRYAPAWARLGRIYRVLAKYQDEGPDSLGRAERAFQRALEINPDLSVAHNLSAYLDADLGRAPAALIRLLDRARTRSGDPELFAGLSHVCRYAGLLEASVAAHEHARRLDRLAFTSALHTFWILGDYERALAEMPHDTVGYMAGLIRLSCGQRDEAIASLRRQENTQAASGLRDWAAALRALIEDDREGSLAAMDRILGRGFHDPEGLYYLARQQAYLREPDRAMDLLERAIDGEFLCVSPITRDPWFDALRASDRFARLLRRATMRHREVAAAFLEAGGDRVLGANAVPAT